MRNSLPSFAAAMLFVLCGFTQSCAPRLLSERPPENYQGPVVEGPVLQSEDYWIYRRADGDRVKVGAGNLLAKVEFPLWIGRIWKFPSTASLMGQPVASHRIATEVECEAVAFRLITVPAGTFEAFECQCRCTVIGGPYDPWCGDWTIWYAPQVKNIARMKTEGTASSFDLVEYKLSERVSGPPASGKGAKPRLEPNAALAFYNRGNAYREKGDYDDALREYNEAIRLNPNYADAFNNRGITYRAKRDYDRAIQDYDQAIRLDPKYAAAFNNRGNVYRDRKDYDRAIQDYDEAIRLNPNSALAFNNRANAYRNKRDYDRAIVDYEAAARIDPKLTRHRLMGHTFFYLGRVAESAEAMAQAAKAAPHDKYAVLWRYLTQAKSGDLQAAARELGDNAAKVKERGWPAPVIDFYLGKIDEKAMYAATENPNAKKKSEQICEAKFYAAEARLLKGATEDAIPLLRAAEKECPPTFYESHGASAELKRLGQ